MTFDPAVVSYREMLDVFFATHDPTTLNRQGNDVGTQYRSAIFYHSPEQKRVAEEAIAELSAAAHLATGPIVTEVDAARRLLPGRGVPPGLLPQQPEQGYCQAVVAPEGGQVPQALRRPAQGLTLQSPGWCGRGPFFPHYLFMATVLRSFS